MAELASISTATEESNHRVVFAMVLPPKKTRIIRMREVKKCFTCLLNTPGLAFRLKAFPNLQTETDTRALVQENSLALTGVKRAQGRQATLWTRQ